MLETIREFGLEQLAHHSESAAARYRHAQFFLEYVEASEPGLRCPQQDRWLDRLAPELDNVRAALQWSETAVAMGGSNATEAALLGLRLAAVVWRFCIGRGYMKEARNWLEGAFARLRQQIAIGDPELVAHPDLEQVRRAWAKGLVGIGMVARMQGDLEHAEACLYESLYLSYTLNDRLISADALIALGNVTWLRGEVSRTEELFDQCLAIYRELGDDLGIIWALIGLGNVSQAQEAFERAIRLHQEGLRHASLIGFKRLIAWSQSNLGSALLAQGKIHRAERLLLESLDLLQMLRDRQGIAHVLCRLGSLTAQQGDTRRAVAYFEESMALHRELGDRQGVLTCLHGLAGLGPARSSLEP
jgi:tetratricopeptide (TPR) repeat protein